VKYDVIVLGAGMVGVSCALHLQRRGCSVALLDRRGPGQETSYGNAGLIQREAQPHALPRNPCFLLGAALNRRLDVRVDLGEALRQAGPLFSYFRHSAPGLWRTVAREYETLIEHCLDTHQDLMTAAQAQHLIAPTGGYLALYRTRHALHKAYQEADARAAQGIRHVKLDAAELAVMEPSLQVSMKTPFVGAVHWTDPLAILSPGALVQAYVRLFERLGGAVRLGDADTLVQCDGIWQVRLASDDVKNGDVVQGRQAVIALGPWSVALTAKFGYRPPMFVKRGYHMHYARLEDRPLQHWMLDAEKGYALCPMSAGIRLTTGAELASMDAPPAPKQLEAAERVARTAFPLGQRLDAQPWMGARPCLPDMKPVFGALPGHPNLWCAFGHGHQGFTLGPITGELLAAQMTGANPRVDVTPFSPARWA